MVGWLKLKCAIQTESVKIQNVKIDVYPDATTGCIKHYLLAEITKSGHQFVMRNFDAVSYTHLTLPTKRIV